MNVDSNSTTSSTVTTVLSKRSRVIWQEDLIVRNELGEPRFTDNDDAWPNQGAGNTKFVDFRQ